MAGLDLATCEAKLAEYLAAETKILKNQSVQIDGDTYTRADLAAIQAGIEMWDLRVKRYSTGTRRSLGYGVSR